MKKLLIFLLFITISCVNKNSKIKNELVCIDTFFIRVSSTPNPDAVVFIIKTNDSLRLAFNQKNWDSIVFSGGIFDSMNYNAYNPFKYEKSKLIEPVGTEKNPEDYFIAFRTAKFNMFSQTQVDSIVAMTIPNVEIKIAAYKKIWKIRFCD